MRVFPVVAASLVLQTPAYAYKCGFSSALLPEYECTVESSGGSCEHIFSGTAVKGLCAVVPDPESTDLILSCVIGDPSLTAGMFRNSRANSPSTIAKALAEQPGFLALGSTLAVPKANLITLYHERQGAAFLWVFCGP
jgi:hypothetical protein